MADKKPKGRKKEAKKEYINDAHDPIAFADEDALEAVKKVKPVGLSHFKRVGRAPVFWILMICLILAFFIGKYVPPTYTVEQTTIQMEQDDQGRAYYKYKKKPKYVESIVRFEDAQLRPDRITAYNDNNMSPTVLEEYAVIEKEINGVRSTEYIKLSVKRHWRYWSFLPAVVAILLCWILKEPLIALFSGALVGSFLLGHYNITEQMMVANLTSKSAAGILILYLWLLGGLMGIWSKTGAGKAFAEAMAKHFVVGPRSAKFVAWLLGVIFFQGGTISTVLVGTTVKPLTDKQKISHEELSYIVDSTASPIASLIPLNAWPGYVQVFIFVSGAGFLATEADRINFFFKSIPFSFYSIFAILGTFLLSMDMLPFVGKKLKAAIKRARTTGELDARGAKPLSAKELEGTSVPEGYHPHVIDFVLPLVVLIGTCFYTYFTLGSPQVRWAFGFALLTSILMSLLRGLSVIDLVEGISDGLKGVVMGSVILMLAIIIGNVTKATGSGVFLVELLGSTIPYWILPVVLQLMTMLIAFSTGTSWGTYAVTFPLAMPLAWAVAQGQGLANPEFFMLICFATVLNGSVYGDQCSPISDTTILSSMCTGCDLMDHVKTQIPPASMAAGLAAICWTGAVILFA